MSDEKECQISPVERILWVVVLVLPLTLLGGWAFRLMWSWFFMPLGAPAISLFHAAGIYLVLRVVLLTTVPNSGKKHPLEDAAMGAGTLLAMLGILALIKLGV